MAFALGFSASASAQVGSNCMPTCDETDGRFLSIAGPNLSTLTNQDVNVQLTIPGDVGEFRIWVFDGDTSRNSGTDPDTGEPLHWDLNSSGQGELRFELFYDDGTGDPVSNPIYPLDGGTMPDNDWFTAPAIATDPRAQGPDGMFRYRLRVRLIDPGPQTISNFKIRAAPDAILTTIGEPFGFQAPLFSLADAEIIYPDFPHNTGDPNVFGNAVTTYDGTFTFFARAGVLGENGVDPQEFVVWDGDLDHGSYNGVTADSDDPDTPNNLLPVWAVPEAVFEGAQPTSNFNPPDDVAAADHPVDGKFVRTPSVVYDVHPAAADGLPGGAFFTNTNPSGNQEWERFRLSELPEDATTADFHANSDPPVEDLLAGVYKIVVRGMDLQNFNAWRVPTICTTSEGDPCPEPMSLRVGDRVWQDLDADTLGGGSGVEADGEPGIAGVLMNLYSRDNLINRTVTDTDGEYDFRVTVGNLGAAARYTVQVAPENFAAADPRGSVGDRVWLDADGNGLQSADEPGLANITLVLRDTDDQAVAVARTDANGQYRFNELAPGAYRVDIADGSVPPGLSLSGGSDPSSTVTVTSAAERVDDIDFGYQNTNGAMIGNLIWTDVNRDGVRQAAEPGVNAVTVDLIDLGPDAAFGGGDDTVAATVETRGGRYLFTNVAPGTYVVEVSDLRGRLNAFVLVSAPDGVFATDRSAPFTVNAGDAVLDKDFGYFRADLPVITDSVWLDADRDGVRDHDELGIANVTINLTEDLGIEGSDTSLAVATSDANGVFAFSGQVDGDYRLVLTGVNGVLAGLLATTPAALNGHAVTVEDLDVSGNNFGFNTAGQLANATNTTPGGPAPQQIEDVVQTENVLTYDFGYQLRPFVIGDDVFEDLDQSGLPRDAAEPGIAGVVVNLRDAQGALIARTVTDGNGKYYFPVLTGDYTVEIAGENLSTDALGALGDRVWLDLNNNGIDDGEPGIPNVGVVLHDPNAGVALAAAGTDSDGFYRFHSLPPGDYRVAVADSTLPAGLALSGGSNPSVVATIPAAGGEVLDLDFGYTSHAGTGSIGDFVWLDSDGDGFRDTDEPGIGGVSMHLVDGTGRTVATVNTRGGYYLFAGLPPAAYRVDVADANFGPGGALEGLSPSAGVDPTAPIAVAAGDFVLDADFGYRGSGALHSIGDVVWRDADRDGVQDAGENGVADVTVTLEDADGDVIARTSTDGVGAFAFGGLRSGDYRVDVTDVNGVLSDLIATTIPAVTGLPVVLAGADVFGVHFGYASTGQLADAINTTGGTSISRLVQANDDTFDFGFATAIPPEECGACDGKVTELTLRYLGHLENAHVLVIQKKDGAAVFDDIVQPGETFHFSGTYRGTLGTDIYIYVNGQLNAKIHTSCSQPIGPGLVSGDFEVTAGASKNGGPLCPLEGCVDVYYGSSDDSSSDERRKAGRRHGQNHDGSDEDGKSRSADEVCEPAADEVGSSEDDRLGKHRSSSSKSKRRAR